MHLPRPEELPEVNRNLRNCAPEDILAGMIIKAKRPVVTTNFRPYEAALLYACVQVKKDIPVIWCDTGYNTSHTYRHAEELIKLLNLSICLYVPKQSTAHRNTIIGGIPGLEDSNHPLFTDQVKLEPFRRAMKEHRSDVWLTNLRKGQTALRNSMNIVNYSSNGIYKVSPFYYWSNEELDDYLAQHDLPNETRYFDPTKVLDNRECGIHSK